MGLWWIVGRRFAAARRFEDLLSGLLGSLDTAQAIGLALLSGFAEELFFRGAVQDTWGFWIASALFAALHTGRDRGMWIWTAFALVAGLLFGGLVLLSGNLLAAMVAHVLVNAINLRRLARSGARPRAVERTLPTSSTRRRLRPTPFVTADSWAGHGRARPTTSHESSAPHH